MGRGYVLRETRSRKVISISLSIADTPWERMIGLIGRRSLGWDESLLLTDVNSIHTWFVGFPLDIAFLDADFHVLETRTHLKPFRIAMCPEARHTLELPAGKVVGRELRAGLALSVVAPGAQGGGQGV